MSQQTKIIFGLIAITLTITTAVLWTPNTDRQEMIEKYTLPTDKWAEGNDGLRVHYRVSGPADGQPLILIHGTSASLHTWEHLRAYLEPHHRVIAYDQPGHGVTGPHPKRDYSYDGMADALDAVFAAEGIDHAVLIGNSMGGWIAWRDALANPERVSALVLIDAAGIPSADTVNLPLAFKLLQNPVGRFAALRISPRSIVARSVRQTFVNQDLVTEEMIDRYWALARYPGNRQAFGDMFALEPKDLSSQLPIISVPTLILWGREDNLIPVSSAQKFGDAIPNARVIIYDETGHLPMEELPAQVANDISSFLTNQTTLTPIHR